MGNGDSTAKWGWGYELPFLFSTWRKFTFTTSRSGRRTSKSFIDEGRWTHNVAFCNQKLLRMSAAAILSPGSSASTTATPNSLTGSGDAMTEGRGGQQVHTYGWYLEQYAKDAKAKGATAIILSPVPLNGWTNGKLNRGFEGYVQWAKDAATAQNALYINMNGLIADHLDPLGSKEKAMVYFVPDSHTTKAGARVNAALPGRRHQNP